MGAAESGAHVLLVDPILQVVGELSQQLFVHDLVGASDRMRVQIVE